MSCTSLVENYRLLKAKVVFEVLELNNRSSLTAEPNSTPVSRHVEHECTHTTCMLADHHAGKVACKLRHSVTTSRHKQTTGSFNLGFQPG